MAGNGTHRPRRWLLPLILVVVTLALATPASPTRTDVLLRDGFDLGLITSEYAYWNPGQGVSSPTWEMTSGALFSRGGRGWTGVPDTCSSLNAGSTSCTNSAVFRLNTKSYAFGNATVSFDLVNNSLVSTAATPAVAWDGVHIFLRYQSQYSLYYASVNR